MFEWSLTPKEKREIRDKIRPIIKKWLNKDSTSFAPLSIILPLADVLEEFGEKYLWWVLKLRRLEEEWVDYLKKSRK